LEKGGAALGIDKSDPKNDLLNNLPPPIDPLASLGIDSGKKMELLVEVEMSQLWKKENN
jgi:hypothetical protein